MVKRIIFFSGAIVVSFFILSSFVPCFAKELSKDYTKEIFVIPKSVELRILRSIEDSPNDIFIELSVTGATNGCDKVSQLKIAKKLTEEENKLLITIHGYKVARYIGKGSCIAVVLESKARINISNLLKQKSPWELVVYLNDKENRYLLYQDKYAVYIKTERAVNVFLTGFPETNPVKVVVLIRPTTRLYRLYMCGSYYTNVNYNPLLREFAYQHQLIPADQLLKGLPNKNKDTLYVLSPNLPKGKILGSITAVSHNRSHSVKVCVTPADLNSYWY